MNGWTIGPGFETMLGAQLVGQARVPLQPVRPHDARRHEYRPDPSNHAIRAGITYRLGGLGVASSDEQAPPGPTNVNWTGIYGGVAAGAGMGFGKVTRWRATPRRASTAAARDCWAASSVGGDYQFTP